MDAISDYVVSKEKLVYRSDASAGTAEDTDKVAGVASTRIATAVSSEDRETVKNAQNLAGHPLDYFLTSAEGASLTTLTADMKEVYGKEIKSLRDEVYQLKNQLAKNGFVRNDGQYTGFHDLFQSNRPVHEYKKIGDANIDGISDNNKIKVDEDAWKQIDLYDFIAIKNVSLNETFVKQVIAKDKDGETITLDSDIEFRLRASKYELYKSSGIDYNGQFEFAKDPVRSVGDTDYYSGVSDDSYHVYQRLYQPLHGYAYDFKIPEGKTGFLSDVELCMRAYGTPGAIMCYLIDERDLDNFRNPAQAQAAYQAAQEKNDSSWHFFAASKPFTLQASLGKQYCRISFERDGQYPFIPTPEEGQIIRYILIVELQKGDSSNYYNLLFLQHHNNDGTLSDLQLNNTTYHYTSVGGNDLTTGIVTDAEINAMDLFYQVHTKACVDNEPVPNNSGLYSALIYTNEYQKEDIRRARVTLRIGREGRFGVTVDPSPSGISTQEITLVNQDPSCAITNTDDLCLKGELYKPYELRNGESEISTQVPVIIGSNATTIKGYSKDAVTTNTPVMLFDQDPLYRLGYWVSIKACHLDFDTKTGILSKGDTKRYNLPLTCIVRDEQSDDKTMSPRLVFEGDMPDGKYYNYFELQVYWENKSMSIYHDIRQDQMGIIKELTVSLDRYF